MPKFQFWPRHFSGWWRGWWWGSEQEPTNHSKQGGCQGQAAGGQGTNVEHFFFLVFLRCKHLISFTVSFPLLIIWCWFLIFSRCWCWMTPSPSSKSRLEDPLTFNLALGLDTTKIQLYLKSGVLQNILCIFPVSYCPKWEFVSYFYMFVL